MPLLTTVPRALQTESATVDLSQKKKKPENCVMDKKSFMTSVSGKITNTAPHSKTHTHNICNTLKICSWPAFQYKVSSKGLLGRSAARDTLLASAQL